MARLSTVFGHVRRNTAASGPVPGSYTPSDLASAYALPSTSRGAGQRVAIVDAYDDPSAESDLGVYRSYFSLGACTSSTGCFRKVDQNGGTLYPVFAAELDEHGMAALAGDRSAALSGEDHHAAAELEDVETMVVIGMR